MTWTRKNKDFSDEQFLAIGMIVSDVFLAKMNELFEPEFFINDSLKAICLWCLHYYKKFEQAPKQHIQDIYDDQKHSLDKADSQLIKEFLTTLNKRYVEFDEPINDDYFLARAKTYFTKRNLKVRSQKMQMLLDLDKVEEAEDEIEQYKKFTVAVSPAMNPFADETLQKVFEAKDASFFQYPGALGDMIGPIGRGYLVGILGSFKRGKTAYMLNTATHAASSKMKVVIFSLEMRDVKVAEKIIRNIGTFTKEKDRLFPCFDCRRNQTGSCSKSERTNDTPLYQNGSKPSETAFDTIINYAPCTACRFSSPKDYVVETWFERLNYPDLTHKDAKKKADAFKMMYGDNIRLITYPRFTANVKDIERDLALLEEKELFIPDMVVVDYAGILKPEDTREERRIQIDITWKRLAQLASERNCVVVTATQGTRGAIKKKTTDSTDVAEWIGILGHVDIMLSLNQTPLEKASKVLRIGVLAHRHEDFSEFENALVLTNFGAAQAFADSQIVSVIDDD